MREYRALALITLCVACNDPPPRASTSNTAVAQQADVAWGPAERGLRLGLSIHGEEALVVLENVGESPLKVIVGGISLRLEGEGSVYEITVGKQPVSLAREESFARVAPHARHTQSQDLKSAARKPVGSDGGRAIPPGRYRVSATYNAVTAAMGSWWTGFLRSGATNVVVD